MGRSVAVAGVGAAVGIGAMVIVLVVVWLLLCVLVVFVLVPGVVLGVRLRRVVEVRILGGGVVVEGFGVLLWGVIVVV